MKSRKMKQILVLIACLCVIPMMADDEVPADFGDIISDNPTDAPISNYVWMGIVTLLTVVYLIKRKFMKKA